uniref:Tumor necrosis factor alpha-induced protein 8-like protein n=1 Tax=Panagrolaimus superbus TaxID=310955 RepID=A0A914Y332_9BILA
MLKEMSCVPIRQLLRNKAITSSNETKSKESSLALRAQKKILGKLANRGVIKHFVNDTSLRLFDGLFIILKDYYNEKDASKTIKNMLKIAIKLGVMVRENQLNPEQLRYLSDFQKKLESLTLTIMSFAKVDYSYDRNFLTSQLDSTKAKLDTLVGSTLSDKSKRRVSQIFGHISDSRLLDEMFIKKGAYHENFMCLIDDLEKLVDGDEL